MVLQPNPGNYEEFEKDANSRFRDMASLWMQSQPAVSVFLSAVIRDPHAVDDIHQEVAQIVVEKFDTYDRTRPFTPWVIGIAKVHVTRYLHAKKRQRFVLDENLITEVAEEIARVEPELEKRKSALRQCIESLRGTAKRIVKLRYLQELSVSAVAEEVDMTLNAVSVALHRARNILAECISRKLARDK